MEIAAKEIHKPMGRGIPFSSIISNAISFRTFFALDQLDGYF